MGKLSDSCFFNFTCHRAARRLALTKQFIPLNLLLRFLIKTIFAVKRTELQRSTMNKKKLQRIKLLYIMSSIFNYFELKLFYMRPQYKDVFFRRCVSAKSLWGYTKQLILCEWLTMLLKKAFTRGTAAISTTMLQVICMGICYPTMRQVIWVCYPTMRKVTWVCYPTMLQVTWVLK